MRPSLTDRQQQVLDFIVWSLETKGWPPSLREIGADLKIASTNGVNDHLKALERKGYVIRDPLGSRCIRILGKRIQLVDEVRRDV